MPTSWTLAATEGSQAAEVAQRSGRDSLPLPMTSDQRAQINQLGFNDCMTKATAAVKSGVLKIDELPAEFERCTDRFPAAGLFQECKKDLFKSMKGIEISQDDVARCKSILSEASFDPTRPAPVYINGSHVVFGGIGLNRSLSFDNLQVPNYNCTKLKSALSDGLKSALYLLFGNHPKTFLNDQSQASYLKSLSANFAASNPGQKGASAVTKPMDIAGFGRLYGDPSSDLAVAYFPSAACDFEPATGSIFAGLNLFYLIEEKSRTLSPYFGIAYYRPDQKSINTTELVAEILRSLGSTYRPYSKDAHTVVIAASPFKEVDSERDPRNICELPRPHKLVAVVHTLKGSPNIPEYFLLANIRNLCEYGDRRARNLTR